jgi:hypothetical protein
MSHREQILRAIHINFYEEKEQEESAGDREEDHL